MKPLTSLLNEVYFPKVKAFGITSFYFISLNSKIGLFTLLPWQGKVITLVYVLVAGMKPFIIYYITQKDSSNEPLA
jgi:hypothetical protein